MDGALKVFEHHLRLYRRVWKGSLFLSFVSPVLYLASIGVGLGVLVARGHSATLGGLSYAAFVAPGLLAGTAMMTATSETTFPIVARVYWMRTYDAMLASPLGVPDLVGGEVIWLLFRLTSVSAVFFLVMLAFGLVHSTAGPLAILAAIATGVAFGAPIMAWSATQRTDTGLALLYRFVVTPLFILGGTFFPIDRLPQLLQAVAWLTPLAHGVVLARGLTTGTNLGWPALLHLGVLLVYAALGTAVATTTFRRHLAQ